MGAMIVEPGREVSSRVVAVIFSYVNRAVGAAALRQMLDAAGFEGEDVASLRDATRWFTFEETARLYDAAVVTCGDDDIGRRCGEELFRQVIEMGLADFFVATGSVGAACEAVAEYGSRLSDDRPLWVQEVGDDYVVIQSRIDDAAGVHPFFCGVTAGYYSNVPSFFGHAGVVSEFECQRRGAPQCSHRLSWRPIPTVTGTAAVGEVAASSQSRWRTTARPRMRGSSWRSHSPCWSSWLS